MFCQRPFHIGTLLRLELSIAKIIFELVHGNQQIDELIPIAPSVSVKGPLDDVVDASGSIFGVINNPIWNRLATSLSTRILSVDRLTYKALVSVLVSPGM